MLRNLFKSYEGFTPFTEEEAWGIFRLAAVAEAVGWSLLIAGILINKYLLPGNKFAVPIAGRVHGTLFLVYIAAALVLSPSQNWSKKRTIIAAIASAPPYGSLLFEQWAAHQRQRFHFRKRLALSFYHQLFSASS